MGEENLERRDSPFSVMEKPSQRNALSWFVKKR
ncbi:Uncharacterised protein [uncultured Blautia sp.]|nr:Uncharacterised protein [uncultured Blautia sp.]